jgi:hydroxymethylpyrimidine pyrophosphatase-like HAD family hydrolase
MTRGHVSPFRCSAVISDVDGTLVTDDKRLTSRAQATVAHLRASEIKFSMISSRPPRGVGMLTAALGVTTPIGCFNGGVIAAADGSVVTAHMLSPAVARRAVDTLDAHGVQVWIFSGQDWLLRDSDGPYVGLEARTVQRCRDV